MLAPMDERPRQRFDPAGAGAVLIGTMGTSAGLGALGRAAGSIHKPQCRSSPG